MHYDLIIVGAGPAGIFTALELLKIIAIRRFFWLRKEKQ